MYLQNKQEAFGNLISISKDIIRNCFKHGSNKNDIILTKINNSITEIMNYIIKSIINIQVIIIQSGLSGKQQNLVQKNLTFKKNHV